MVAEATDQISRLCSIEMSARIDDPVRLTLTNVTGGREGGGYRNDTMVVYLNMDRRFTRIRISTVKRWKVGEARSSLNTTKKSALFGSKVDIAPSTPSAVVFAEAVTVSVCSGEAELCTPEDTRSTSSSSSILISRVQKKVIRTEATFPTVHDMMRNLIPVQDVSPIATWSGMPITNASTIKPDMSAATFIMA